MRMPRWFASRRTAPDLGVSRDRVIWIGGKVAGILMNHEEALRLSAVWACVTVIAKSIAASEWTIYEQKANGDRDFKPNTIAASLLNTRPNPEMTAFSCREAQLIQALIWSDSYCEIERDAVNRPAWLWPIDPDRARLERGGNSGALQLRVTNADRADSILPYEDVFHLHGPGIDGICGFDVVQMAARTFAQTAAADRFGQSFFANGAHVGGVLSSATKMVPEDKAALLKEIEEKVKGADKAFGIAFITGGAVEFRPWTTDPEKSQLVETRQHQIEEVCRWFGVPPHIIQHLLRSTNNNIEHQGIEFVRLALKPWARRLEQEADWKMLPQRGALRTAIDLDWLAEGDDKSKAEADSIRAQNGLRTRNEIRRKRGDNALPDENANKLTVQSQMMPLEKIGEDRTPATVTPAGDSTVDAGNDTKAPDGSNTRVAAGPLHFRT